MTSDHDTQQAAPPLFAIIFDDADRPPLLVLGEAAARARFTEYSISWNAHLFVKVGSNTRDDPHYHNNASLPTADQQPKDRMNNVSAMVNAFLAWKLPKDFCPDAGISFKPTKPYEGDELGNSWWPVGTNLFSAEQARAMFEHVIAQADQQTPLRGEHHTRHVLWGDEKYRRVLAAWTQERDAGYYPPYINLTMGLESNVLLTVRLPLAPDGAPGDTASVRFTRGMWRRLIRMIPDADKVWLANDVAESMI